MKVGAWSLLLFLQLALTINAQEKLNPPIKSNNSFKSGEILTYHFKYGIISAGIATLKIKETRYQHKKVFHSVTKIETTGLSNKIYGIKDIYESWFDQETNLPYKHIRNIKEGRYTKYNEVTYDRKANLVNSKISGVHVVPEMILDLSSTMYYIRRIDFSKYVEGDSLLLNMYFSDEVFPFHFIYNGKETIRTKFGKINCIKLSPRVEVGRIFKQPDDVTVWFSDDDNCFPVMVEMDIRVAGKVFLKLIAYENTANPVIFQE